MKYLSTDIFTEKPTLCGLFFGDIYIKRKCVAILKNRDVSKVSWLWRQKGFDYRQVLPISSMIAQTLHWPNSLFCPDDDTEVIIWDFDGTFGCYHLWQNLSDVYQINPICPNEDFFQRPYWLFMADVLCLSTIFV